VSAGIKQDASGFGAQGIEAEFFRARREKIGADSPVFCGEAVKNAQK
jgi:hypothetical protein